MKYGIALKVEHRTLYWMKLGSGKFDWRVDEDDATRYKTMRTALDRIVELEEMMGMAAYDQVRLVTFYADGDKVVSNPW